MACVCNLVTKFSPLSLALKEADLCHASGGRTDLAIFFTRLCLDDEFAASAEELSLLYVDGVSYLVTRLFVRPCPCVQKYDTRKQMSEQVNVIKSSCQKLPIALAKNCSKVCAHIFRRTTIMEGSRPKMARYLGASAQIYCRHGVPRSRTESDSVIAFKKFLSVMESLRV